MSLQFIGERGVYLSDKDAVKIIAIVGDAVVDCYVTRSALNAIGATSREAMVVLRAFEERRIDCEIAAMVKYRRATAKLASLDIVAEDLAAIDRPHAA